MRLTTRNDRLTVTSTTSPALVFAFVIGALLLIYLLDRVTEAAPVQHLYYLPIIIAAIRFGRRGGLIVASSAIVLYHAASPRLLTFRYGESDLVQIVLFLAVSVVTAKLALDEKRMRQIAMTDDLTGLHNLRSFEGRLMAMVRSSQETGQPLALLILDVDRLKSLNDQYGHLTGAEAVRTVGHIVGRRLPAVAVACRYGGDEFAIAIPECPPPLVHRIADDLRRAVHETAPMLSHHSFPAGTLSISVGAASTSFHRNAASAWAMSDVAAGEALFRAADAELYRAKTEGRNRVSVV
jgi:diguanylate cyclase (GGDEF)-like protein